MTAPADELIGRDEQHAALMQAASMARAGQGAIILLSGEAGIGKTTLARRAISESGLLLLEGRAYQGVPLPYGPLVAALRDYLPEQMDEMSAAQLAMIQPGPGTPAADVDRAALFEALRGVIASICRGQPAALFLDDLHWADHATLELLPALAGALEREALLIVGSYRSDEIPRIHPLRRLRADLRRIGRLRQILVEPLDARQTARLAARVLGAEPAPALGTALFDRTEGVPFFIEEFALALNAGSRLRPGPAGLVFDADEGLPLPESIRDVIGLRTEGLPAQARRVLDIAAVAGHEFDLELVMSAAGDDAAGLARLLEDGLLTEVGGGRAAFRHALTREACYLAVSWPSRRALHRDIAARLEESDVSPAVVAEHWLACRDLERARLALMAGAEASCRVHAYRDAGVAYRRALELWPEGADEVGRRDLLEQMGSCAERSGDLVEAGYAWREVSGARRQVGDMEGHAMAERRLAGVYELRGEWDLAQSARETAAAAFVAAGQHAEAAGELLLTAGHLRNAANPREALVLLDLARVEIEQSGRVDLRARFLGLEGNLRARMGDGAAGLDLVRAGLTLALEHNQPGPAAEVYQRLADSLEHAGEYSAARDTYLQASKYCRTHHVDPMVSLCMACLSVVLRQTGEWEQAMTVCRDILATPDTPLQARAVAGGTLGALHALRGDARSARPLLQEAVSLAKRIELAPMEILATWGLALIADLNGTPEAAVGYCRELLDRWGRIEERHYVLPALRWAVTYCAEHGADREARACAAALATIAADIGQPEALSALAHAFGETALIDGDIEQAVNQFEQALDLLRDGLLPLDSAQTERRCGNALVLAGQKEAGIKRLSTAYRTARNLGARPLAALVTSDLLALGEPVERHLGRRAADHVANNGLSRREMEVLRLVAVGLTSREIGQQLFISPRTVEMHVQSILTRLDCRSRAEATRKASELGLLEEPAGRGA